MSGRLFVFGLGYTATRLAVALMDEGGWTVGGTTRAPDKASKLRTLGIETHLFDRERPLDPATFASATHVLVSTPPGEHGDPALAAHGADIARLQRLDWFGYLSTTGVYGNHDGGWVDATTPTAPSSERSRRRVEAERGWLRLATEYGLPVHVFRLSGIYGPGRSALDTVRSGRARRIVKPGQVFSRIHVDDIAAIVRASIARPRPSAIYDLADDEPTVPGAPLDYAASLLGLPPPPAIPFEEADLSPMARSFYLDSRRVSSRLTRDELGVELLHPTYREGLEAILAAERAA